MNRLITYGGTSVLGSVLGWVMLRHIVPEKKIEFRSIKQFHILNIKNYNMFFYNVVEVCYNNPEVNCSQFDQSVIYYFSEVHRYPFRVKGVKV